jgi:hypothetical protein
MKVNDYDYVTLDKNKTHNMLTVRMKVGKDVQNSREEETENLVHVMVNNNVEKIEYNSTTECEVCEENKEKN